MNARKIMLILVVLFLAAIPSHAAASTDDYTFLRVNVLNVEPDPIKAGQDFEIRIAVENSGGVPVNNLAIEIKPEYPFETFANEPLVEELGTIMGYVSSTSDYVKTVKFHLKVKDGVKEGTYKLPILIYSLSDKNSVTEKNYEIKITSAANAEISNINIANLIPGQRTRLSFGIKNVGNSRLNNIMFKWESKDDIILPVESSNLKYINSIDQGENITVDFWVVSDLNTEPKLYKLDLTLEYDDVESIKTITEAGTIDTQKRRTVQSKAGIYVGGGTDFDVSFNEYSRGEAAFSVTNIGSNLASSVVVNVIPSDLWVLEGGSSSAIGNVKKGSFSRASFAIRPTEINGENFDVMFTIDYTDTTGLRQRVNKTVSVNSLSFEQSFMPEDPGLIVPEKKTSWWIYGIIIVVIAIASFVIVKRLRRKNKSRLK